MATLLPCMVPAELCTEVCPGHCACSAAMFMNKLTPCTIYVPFCRKVPQNDNILNKYSFLWPQNSRSNIHALYYMHDDTLDCFPYSVIFVLKYSWSTLLRQPKGGTKCKGFPSQLIDTMAAHALWEGQNQMHRWKQTHTKQGPLTLKHSGFILPLKSQWFCVVLLVLREYLSHYLSRILLPYRY